MAHDSQDSPAASNATVSDSGHESIGHGLIVGTEFEPPRMTLALKGELDLAGAPSLEREIEALPWHHLGELVVDLAQLSFIDSTGLFILIKASQRAATARVRFSVVRVAEQPRKLFTIAGVTESLNVQL